MSPADFDQILELFGFFVDGIAELSDRGKKGLFEFRYSGQVHGGGKGVVGGLGHVDVIVGMDWLFRAEHSSSHFNRPVRDHFVDVHIRLGAATSLPNAKREVVVQFAFSHLGGGFNDEFSLFLCQEAELLIGQCAGSF